MTLIITLLSLYHHALLQGGINVTGGNARSHSHSLLVTVCSLLSPSLKEKRGFIYWFRDNSQEEWVVIVYIYSHWRCWVCFFLPSLKKKKLFCFFCTVLRNGHIFLFFSSYIELYWKWNGKVSLPLHVIFLNIMTYVKCLYNITIFLF